MLVHRKIGAVWFLEEDGLGPIAMVHIEIQDSHVLCPGRQCFQGRDCDRVEEAEAHGVIARGVVPRRPKHKLNATSPWRAALRACRAPPTERRACS